MLLVRKNYLLIYINFRKWSPYWLMLFVMVTTSTIRLLRQIERADN